MRYFAYSVFIRSNKRESHGVDWMLPLDWPVSEMGTVRASVTCTITVGVARRSRLAISSGPDLTGHS